MKRLKLRLLSVALVLTASFGYAQEAANPKTQTDSITISTRSIPNPMIYIGDGTNKNVLKPKEVVLEQPYLTAKDPLGTTEWAILSYKVRFVKDGKEEPPIDVIGSQFTEEMISRIQSAELGTMIEFSNFKVQSDVAGTREVKVPRMIRIR